VFGMGTGGSPPLLPPETCRARHPEHSIASTHAGFGSSPRPISTGQLNTLLRFHFRPIYLVFYQGPYPLDAVGGLILESASHLDAFSAYPLRT
jgi:hypothetical protein